MNNSQNRYDTTNRMPLPSRDYQPQRNDRPRLVPEGMPYSPRELEKTTYRGSTAQINRQTTQNGRLPLAMAWFGDQEFGETYEPKYALKAGTLFPELNKPWLAGNGGRQYERRYDER